MQGVRLSRLVTAALCAGLAVSACKVAPTPQEYIDHRQSIATLREGAEEELRVRLLAMGQALNRDDLAEATLALAPSGDAYLVAAGRSGMVTGETAMAGVLGAIASGERPVRLSDVRVTVGPRANVAWFHAVLDPEEAAGVPSHRLTGVYVRGDQGEWRLVQAHLSAAGAVTGPLPADSLPPSPAPASVPPGDG